MVCTIIIAPPYISTTTIAQRSASIVQMLSDLPSKFLLACNRRLKLFPFVNVLTDDPDTLILHPTFYLIHPIHHTHTVDSWCVLVCTCAEVVRSKVKYIWHELFSFVNAMTCTWTALRLDHVLVRWHSSFLPISYGGPTSQPCRLVPTVRSSPRCPIGQVVDLSLPVPSAWSPQRVPLCHLVWPLANQVRPHRGISLEPWNLSNIIVFNTYWSTIWFVWQISCHHTSARPLLHNDRHLSYKG